MTLYDFIGTYKDENGEDHKVVTRIEADDPWEANDQLKNEGIRAISYEDVKP
jgi:hypothetical protein